MEMQTRPPCKMFYDMCKQVLEALGIGLVHSMFTTDCPLYVFMPLMLLIGVFIITNATIQSAFVLPEAAVTCTSYWHTRLGSRNSVIQSMKIKLSFWQFLHNLKQHGGREKYIFSLQF
jgi:hypothetical protein